MTSRSATQGEPAVAVGSSQRAWVAELMSYAQDHAGVRVVGTVLSSREAVESDYDVLLIDDTTSYLTKRLIDRVHMLRRIVIGVYELDRGEVGRDKLLDMGVDAVIEADASAKEFLGRIRFVTDQQLIDKDFAEMVAAEESPSGDEPQLVEDSGESHGRSLTVVTGANGVTELSVGLAVAVARSKPVVLADLDTVEPTLAQRLGVELTPNVLTAIEELRHTGSTSCATIEHSSGMRILGGLPSPREWESCNPDDVVDLLSELAADGGSVVVRVNRQLEDLSPFGVRLGRFGVARRLVAEADQLIVVGDPSPTGVTSLLAWIGEARGLTGSPIHVVLNHCGRSIYQHGEITEEIGRTFNAASVTFLPEDGRVRKASWQGETTPPGRFLRAIEPLAHRLAPSSITGARPAT